MDKYAEPEAVTQELFNRLDVVFITQTKDGVLTIEDIITAYKSISLFPPLSEVKKMFHELGTNFLTYEQFRSMRSSIHRCELNALSEFKKYESRRLAKGVVTIESVKKVRFSQELYRHRIDSQIAEEIVQSFTMCDKNKDGIATYRDIYDYMMGRIPHDWLQWLVSK